EKRPLINSRGCYRSIPKEATLPANLAPALPRFCNFSRSLLSIPISEYEGECFDVNAFSAPAAPIAPVPAARILGKALSVSLPPLPAEVATDGTDPVSAPGTRAVRWLTYSCAAAESGIAGGCWGISAPF